MASKHPLRRLCVFCRARKIKCSNETICKACRRQGANCIYDFEPPRPKARTISQDGSKMDQTVFGSAPGLQRPRSTNCSSTNGSPGSVLGDDGLFIEEVESVSHVLECRFYENFSSDAGPRSSPWQERMSAYHRSARARGATAGASTTNIAASFTVRLAAKNFKYSGILSLLTHDLVGLIADQFGALGCHYVEDGGARFFLSSLEADETKTIFDNEPPGGNPLAEYGQRQQTQLIDVFDVEKELVAYFYWTTYSLSLGAFLQMGHGHFSALLPTSLTSIFLPVTEASSVMIQLDLVSENFSTLQKQKAVIREMWPLAHIASVIAYIFALHPHDGDVAASPTTSFWQEAPLLALQRIQQGKPSQGMASVCRDINRVLMESIHILNRQVSELSSRSLVLLVYHTMAVHFLFPLLPAGPEPEPVTADVLERFCASAQEMLHIFGLVADQPQQLLGAIPSLRSSFPNLFCLALDTYARALSLLDSRHRRRARPDVSLQRAPAGLSRQPSRHEPGRLPQPRPLAAPRPQAPQGLHARLRRHRRRHPLGPRLELELVGHAVAALAAAYDGQPGHGLIRLASGDDDDDTGDIGHAHGYSAGHAAGHAVHAHGHAASDLLDRLFGHAATICASLRKLEQRSIDILHPRRRAFQIRLAAGR